MCKAHFYSNFNSSKTGGRRIFESVRHVYSLGMSACSSDSYFDVCEIPLYEKRTNIISEQQNNRLPLRKRSLIFKLFENRSHRRSDSVAKIN